MHLEFNSQIKLKFGCSPVSIKHKSTIYVKVFTVYELLHNLELFLSFLTGINTYFVE